MQQREESPIRFGLLIIAIIIVAIAVPLMMGIIIGRVNQQSSHTEGSSEISAYATDQFGYMLSDLAAQETTIAAAETRNAQRDQVLEIMEATKDEVAESATQLARSFVDLSGQLTNLQAEATKLAVSSVTATADWSSLPQPQVGLHEFTDLQVEAYCEVPSVSNATPQNTTKIMLVVERVNVSDEIVVVNYTQQINGTEPVPESCWLPVFQKAASNLIYLKDSAGRHTYYEALDHDGDGNNDAVIEGAIHFARPLPGATSFILVIDRNGDEEPEFSIGPIDLDGRAIINK